MLAIATFPLGPAIAQQTDSASTETTDAAEAEAAEDTLLTSDELDELVAPVALFPDTLLIQIFVAATYPLDVIKAQQWLEDNEGLGQAETSDAVASQDWDPSVQVLTEAFPDVLTPHGGQP